MSVKARLQIVLKADDIVIAESEDKALWQYAFQVISGVSSATPLIDVKEKSCTGEGTQVLAARSAKAVDDKEVMAFGKELDVPIDSLIGACAPSKISPYIHFDRHYWEALTKVVPKKGPKSLSSIVVAATILCLWKHAAGLKEPTIKEASAVLKTISLPFNNVRRSLDNCEWLQFRGRVISINPAQNTRAINIAKGYCLKANPYDL